MSEPFNHPLLDAIEPATATDAAHTPEQCALYSMAISLKRIADLMDGSKDRAGVCDSLADIAARMPSGAF